MSAQPQAVQWIEGKAAILGDGMRIVRVVPTVQRRMIGAWCFLDHFGPVNVAEGRGLRVGPHPHIGLQTVTWLLQGEILHRDSLGSVQPIRAGQLNLMTAGRGISHSEESPLPSSAMLHGAQLWIALPESARHGAPAFAHHPVLPVIQHDGMQVTVLLGEALGQRSPGLVHTPLVGMELRRAQAGESRLPLNPAFEYGAIVLEQSATIEGDDLAPGSLLYFAPGRSELNIRTQGPACVLLVGGEPFPENMLMWWNFVARSKEELTQVSRDWNAGADYLGTVHGYDGARLVSPLPPWADAPT